MITSQESATTIPLETVGMVVAVILGIVILLYWSPRIFGRLTFGSEIWSQAVADQRKANYPGCARGVMKCYDLCYCRGETRKKASWLFKRARVLTKRRDCTHEIRVPKFDRMFPEIGRRGEQCFECRLVRQDVDSPWKESDD